MIWYVSGKETGISVTSLNEGAEFSGQFLKNKSESKLFWQQPYIKLIIYEEILPTHETF